MIFGSTNLLVHFARGIGGFGALAISLATMNEAIWPSLILMPAALYLLRGCPVCWTIGVFETLAMRVHRQEAANSDEICKTC